MAMTVEGALFQIQKAIDRPGIDPIKKRQLFSLYQNIKNAIKLTPEVESMITDLSREN